MCLPAGHKVRRKLRSCGATQRRRKRLFTALKRQKLEEVERIFPVAAAACRAGTQARYATCRVSAGTAISETFPWCGSVGATRRKTSCIQVNQNRGHCHVRFRPETRRRTRTRQQRALSQRERRISPRPRAIAGGGDRVAPPHRARRRVAPRAAAGRRGDEELCVRRRGRQGDLVRTCSATSRRS